MALDPRELTCIRVLRGLKTADTLSFLSACRHLELPADTLLIEEGAVDRSMVFVLQGALEVFVGRPPQVTALRRTLRGEHLGELSALGLVPHRTASVRTATPCALLSLDEGGVARLRDLQHPVVDRIETEVLHALAMQLRETDRRIAATAVGETVDPEPDGLWQRIVHSLGRGRPLGSAPRAQHVLRGSPHFSTLDERLIKKLAREMIPVAFARGERIVIEGDLRGDAWVVAAGRVSAWRETTADRRQRLDTLQPGALFGHIASLDSDLRTATCIADTPAWLYRVPRELCENVMDASTPDGRALRTCLITASIQQLQSANQRLDQVSRAYAARHRPDLFTAADLNAARPEGPQG